MDQVVVVGVRIDEGLDKVKATLGPTVSCKVSHFRRLRSAVNTARGTFSGARTLQAELLPGHLPAGQQAQYYLSTNILITWP